MHPYTCYKTDHLQRSRNCIKKKIGSGMKNILLLMSLHLRKKKLITDFKHTFNVIIITVNGGELF